MRADRVERAESAVPAALVETKRRVAAAEDVIDTTAGDPTRRPPREIRDAAHDAVDTQNVGYPPLRGLPEFREVVVAHLRASGVPADTNSVLATAGATPALYTCLQALVDRGTEVVLPQPAWHGYEPMIALAGGTLTRASGPQASDPHPTERAYQSLSAAVTDDTDVLIVNTPVNPTGRVYSSADLRVVATLAVTHDVIVVADETYCRVVFDETPPSVAAVDGLADRTITVRSFSKSYAMTDWRLGYLAAPDRLFDTLLGHHAHATGCVNRVAQRAGLAALRGNDLHEQARDQYRERRDLVLETLETRGHETRVPGGTFYVLLPTDTDDVAWCGSALDSGVGLVPGSVFGAPGHARLATTLPTDRLRTALDRLCETGLL